MPLVLVCLEANSPLHPCFVSSVDYGCKIELCSIALGVCEVSSLWSRSISLIDSITGYPWWKGMAIGLCFDVGGPYAWESWKLILLLNTMPEFATSASCSILFFPLPFSSLSTMFAFWPANSTSWDLLARQLLVYSLCLFDSNSIHLGKEFTAQWQTACKI